jgi:hypothetical protein
MPMNEGFSPQNIAVENSREISDSSEPSERELKEKLDEVKNPARRI